MFPLEPCSFPPPAPHPPLLSCPLPGAHPGHAVTRPIPLCLCVAGPCGTTKLISYRASLAWCASCKVGPYSLHIGSLGCDHRESHLQVPPSPSTILSRDAVLVQGNTRHFSWFTRKNKQQPERKMRILHPWLPSLPSLCCDHSLARHPGWAACSGLVGTACKGELKNTCDA